ncbi:MAG TPA: CHAT domain-containing protein [Pyrinomonadaceae bacterium]|nr:CHAT domain-containing protein [Pyrinomonadaceae bacterium]
MNQADGAFYAGMMLYDQMRRDEALSFFQLAFNQHEKDGNSEGQCRALIMAGETLRMVNKVNEGGALLGQAVDIAENQLTSSDARTKANAFSTYGNFLTNIGKADEAIHYTRKSVEEAELTGDAALKSNSYLLLAEALLRAYQADSARRPMVLAVFYGRHLQSARARCLPFFSYGVFLKRYGKAERAHRWLERAAHLSLELPDLQLRCNCCMEFGSISPDSKWLKEAAEIARSLPDAHTAVNAFIAYAMRVDGPERSVWLRRAAAKLPQVHDPHTRTVVQEELIKELFWRGQWSQILERSVQAVSDLLISMRHNPFVYGVEEIARSSVVPYGVFAADKLQRAQPETHAIVAAVSLLDAVKCVQIREGLRRHIEESGESEKTPWSDGPPHWKHAFLSDWFSESGLSSRSQATLPLTAMHSSIRGNRSRELTPRHYRRQSPQLPARSSVKKDRFCDALQGEEIGSLLSDDRTLILYFAVVADDIVILPIHRESDVIVVEGDEKGMIWIRDARKELEKLVHRQTEEIADIFRQRFTLSQICERKILTSLYGRAFELIDGHKLLEVLSRRVGSVRNWHLVIIPDGPLYELPMHAFVSGDRGSERFYQHFQSFHYALSLKTLHLQRAIKSAVAASPDHLAGPRLCVFANPDRQGNRLPSVCDEAAVLVKLMDEVPGAQWRVFGDTENVEFRASVDNFEKWHGSGNLLWASGHGVQSEEIGADGTSEELAFLLCDDGIVGPSELLRDAYDFSSIELFMASACLLGKIPGASFSGSMVRAFNATLALRGCRRVTSALWELDDNAAVIFAEKYLRAILKHCFAETASSHAYARAYVEALHEFRLHDKGRFDNELFWAPYTNYGLG